MSNVSVFTKIINGDIPSKKIYEDNKFIAILDVNPSRPGHTILIPKIENKNIFEENEEIKKEILIVATKISNHMKERLNNSGIKLVFNSGKSAGQEIFHTHLHIIPYYDNDIKLSIDEVFKKLI